MHHPDTVAEPHDPRHEVGAHVQRLRRARGMTAAELGHAAGISASMVSRIEQHRGLPSMATLYAITDALSVSIEDFFVGATNGIDPVEERHVEGRILPRSTVGAELRDRPAAPAPGPAMAPPGPSENQPIVTRAADRAPAAAGVPIELLTPGTGLSVAEQHFGPGAGTDDVLRRAEGLMAVLVRTGTIAVDVLFDSYDLGAGDAITFAAAQPHRIRNAGEGQARTILIRVAGR